ncbi:unnamed protein product [Phytophthora fragariaefolia]|uniref:Unnamed protein product n=1 Tax=Phytophthora fragariaefolia TaxID=1490495 RepID=A0A9W6Y1I2_9STRA|nr:unnamed protein product [Phytophthora fragariaefolia]
MCRNRHINPKTSSEEILVLIQNEYTNDTDCRHACCICSSEHCRRFLSDDWKLRGFHIRRHFNGDDATVVTRDDLKAIFGADSDADMEDGEEDEETSSSRRDDPGVGSRRPREDDSDASSSKR